MTGMKLSRRATVASAIAGVASAALPARAQDFPSKPITIVVPFGPGTTNDVIARQLGQHMMGALGQSVIIDNRAGATGNIAADLVAKSKPDGHTLFIPSMSQILNQVTNNATTDLTRAGSFSVDSNYNLVNAQGYKVLDSTGTPISFPHTGLPANTATDFNKVTAIGTDGSITYLAADGTTSVTLANAGTPVKIGVSTATNTSLLTKMGGSLYKDPSATLGAPNGTSEQVLSNSLEQSNVDMASEFVNMIVTQRAYSANSKTITTTDEMTQEVLGLIR